MDDLKRFVKRVMRRVTPEEKAAEELALAELSRLEAQSALEYASSMVDYHNARIRRLREFLKDPTVI